MIVDIVVQHGRSQGAEFTHGGTETVCGRSNGDGEYLGSDQESSAVGSELLEETREEVDGLESVDMCRFTEVIVRARGNQL